LALIKYQWSATESSFGSFASRSTMLKLEIHHFSKKMGIQQASLEPWSNAGHPEFPACGIV